MAVQLNPHSLEPIQFAKLCGGLIAVFFVLIFATGFFSGLGRQRPARCCCYASCVYFAVSTAYIMYGMVVSFEVARSKFDKYN